MVITGFDKHLKEHMSRIESIKTLMTLRLAEGIYASMTGKHLQHLLPEMMNGLKSNRTPQILRQTVLLEACRSRKFCSRALSISSLPRRQGLSVG
jgi:hypothetical protein